MYPQLSIWQPVVAVGTLVASALLATSSVSVEPGETLSEIAVRNDVTVAQLMEWNDLSDPDRIFAGTSLIVSAPAAVAPAGDEAHVVTAGETLSEIAVRFGTTVGRLVAANDLDDADRIFAGQRLRMAQTQAAAPAATPAAAPARSHTVVAGDTLGGIAEQYGVRTGVLARDNGIDDPDRIVIGTVLSIGRAAPAEPAPPAPPAADPPTPTTTPSGPTRGGTVLLVPLFERWSHVYDVPQDLLEAIAWRETDWHPDTVGPAGHLGITQLSPDTVDLIEGGLLGREVNPLDAGDGIQIGARYLRYLMDRTGSEREAVAAWQQGLQSVQRDGVTAAGDVYVDSVEAIRELRS